MHEGISRGVSLLTREPAAPKHMALALRLRGRDQAQLRLRQQLLLLSVARNARELYGRAPRPNPVDIFARSFVFRSPPASIRHQRLSLQFVSSNYENAVRLRVRNIYHSQVSTSLSLSNCDSRTLASWSIFARSGQYILDLTFGNLMVMNMRHSSRRINIVTDVHRSGPRNSLLVSAGHYQGTSTTLPMFFRASM
jgi:hypothetical protein